MNLLRKALLPKLPWDELRVESAEKLVEDKT
jgi:hypothetical protein